MHLRSPLSIVLSVLLLSGLVLCSAGQGQSPGVVTKTAGITKSAPKLQLIQPIGCRIGSDCWIYNHVDWDDGPGVVDYTCGHRTYDGHNGTDFGLRDDAQMQAGVPVLAAASGVVKSVRDGVEDVSVKTIGKSAVEGKECGNGVLIDHGQGWTTQYCHMMEGSVRVKVGDTLRAGQALGVVGMSGLTEYPHLHFIVRQNNKIVDPFTGSVAIGLPKTCSVSLPVSSLWAPATLPAMAYESVSIYNIGVASTEPTFEGILAGRYPATSLSRLDKVVAVWMAVLGLESGDVIRASVVDPQGRPFLNHQEVIKSRYVRWFQYMGKRYARPWQPGVYRGSIEVIRPSGGEHHYARDFHFEVR